MKDEQPLERLLTEAGIFPVLRELDAVVDDFRTKHVELPTAKEIFEGQSAPPPGSRRGNYPLSYVVGPTGSGKTYVALQYLKDFGNDAGLPSVLVYCQPRIGHDHVDYTGERGPAQLAGHFLEQLGGRVESEFQHQWNSKDQTLRMHVCLVVDDADHPHLKGFFNKRSTVTAFVRELKASHFAESLMVVVCGSTLVGPEMVTASEASLFRRKTWSSDEFFRQLLGEVVPSKA